MSSKMDAIAQKVEILTINPTTTASAIQPGCEICGTQGHTIAECTLLAETSSDKVNYAQGNPYSNTYNHGWRNHPNFSYKNNNPTQNSTPQRPSGFQTQRPNQPMQSTPSKSNIEKMVESFITTRNQQNKEFMNQNIHINGLITQLGTKLDYVITHNKSTIHR